MIFKPELAAKILSGEKTQTRRPVHEGDEYLPYFEIYRTCFVVNEFPSLIKDVKGKHRYEVGKTYAVQPGRGKAAIGRIRLTDIRREDVRNISEEDACAEGFGPVVHPRVAFLYVWTGFYDPIGHRFPLYNRDLLIDRPAALYDAWALTFEVVK